MQDCHNLAKMYQERGEAAVDRAAAPVSAMELVYMENSREILKTKNNKNYTTVPIVLVELLTAAAPGPRV